MTANELMEAQTAMEEKVYRIWTVLSAFEESAAACISDMLLQVSEGGYAEGLKMADYFIAHVHVLFAAIDDLAVVYYDKLNKQLNYDRESRMLCKKIENFFSLLSHTQEGGLRRIGTTQELLSLVTGLALPEGSYSSWAHWCPPAREIAQRKFNRNQSILESTHGACHQATITAVRQQQGHINYIGPLPTVSQTLQRPLLPLWTVPLARRVPCVLPV